MTALFVDTSEQLTVGILNDSYQWLEYQKVDTNKTSTVLHSTLDQLMKKSDLLITNIKSFIYVAGPGSYTGLRVAEGMADICDWQNFNVFNLYHFKIPKILGESNYCWASNAFKSETFVYEYSNGQETKKLLRSTDFNEADCYSFEDTQEMIYQKPEQIFQNITQSARDELFYYRKLEQEFSRGK